MTTSLSPSPGALDDAPGRGPGRPGGHRRPVPERLFGATPRQWAALEFLGLVLFQVFHQGEHTLEVLEKRLGHEDLHPLLQGVNFEWMHFGGNTILFLGCLAVLVAQGRRGRARWRTEHYWPWTAFVLGVFLQGLHVGEHIVRVVQYVSSGTDPDGFATKWIDPVWFHFGMNLVFLLGLTIGFVGLKVWRDLRPEPGVSRRAG